MRRSPIAVSRSTRSVCRRATGSIAIAGWWRGTMPSSSTPRRAIARSWRNSPTAILRRPRASWKSGCATVPTSLPAVAGAGAGPQNVALTCPCNAPAAPPPLKKVDAPIKRVDPDPPKRVDRPPPKRVRVPDDDVVVVRRPPPREVYEPSPGPSIGDRHRHRWWWLWRRKLGGGGPQGRGRGGY